MATVVGFLNLKGGVGKTHVSLLATLALSEAGYRVLVKDFDPQGTLSEIVLSWQTLVELERKIKDKVMDTGFKLTWLMLTDVEFNRYLSTGVFNELIVPVETDVGRFDIFPVLPKHYADTFSLTYSREETRLYEFFADLDYDFIIVDLPPQPIPPTAEVLKVIDVIIPPILYNHESSIRPAQLLISKALLNTEVVKSRLYYGKTIPYIPGTVLNMVSKRQVYNGKLKPGLPFLRLLSRYMYTVYQLLRTEAAKNERKRVYIDLSKVRLVDRPYLEDVPFYRSFKVRSMNLDDYVKFYREHEAQRRALKNLVNLLKMYKG